MRICWPSAHISSRTLIELPVKNWCCLRATTICCRAADDSGTLATRLIGGCLGFAVGDPIGTKLALEVVGADTPHRDADLVTTSNLGRLLTAYANTGHGRHRFHWGPTGELLSKGHCAVRRAS